MVEWKEERNRDGEKIKKESIENNFEIKKRKEKKKEIWNRKKIKREIVKRKKWVSAYIFFMWNDVVFIVLSRKFSKWKLVTS